MNVEVRQSRGQFLVWVPRCKRPRENEPEAVPPFDVLVNTPVLAVVTAPRGGNTVRQQQRRDTSIYVRWARDELKALSDAESADIDESLYCHRDPPDWYIDRMGKVEQRVRRAEGQGCRGENDDGLHLEEVLETLVRLPLDHHPILGRLEHLDAIAEFLRE